MREGGDIADFQLPIADLMNSSSLQLQLENVLMRNWKLEIGSWQLEIGNRPITSPSITQ
jgi:hypothetical protein